MRSILAVALVLCSGPTHAQVWDLINGKCEAACKTTLNQCAAVSNKIMETSLKETTAYNIGTADRERADIKFENAFQKAEKCWGEYYKCTATRCQAPRRCVAACQSSFRQCFAAGEKKMNEGLREMKSFAFGSTEWSAAYAKGSTDLDHCLEENHNCQAKCANPEP
jgi:hypothetical protein